MRAGDVRGIVRGLTKLNATRGRVMLRCWVTFIRLDVPQHLEWAEGKKIATRATAVLHIAPHRAAEDDGGVPGLDSVGCPTMSSETRETKVLSRGGRCEGGAQAGRQHSDTGNAFLVVVYSCYTYYVQ